MTDKNNSFTSGKIAPTLIRFALPVLGALFLQSFYGAVDLLVVGQFGTAADVSAVATSTMMIQTITFIITGLAMGTTIQMGQALGAGKKEKAADLLFVAVFKMAAAGAAIATVMAQALSVVFCFCFVRRKGLPFAFSRKKLHWDASIAALVCKTGAPISLQDGLVTVSFLVIAAIINRLGLIASAGVGVAERVCGFIMLVPSAFSQSLSAFVAQNVGAKKYGRAQKALFYAILASSRLGWHPPVQPPCKSSCAAQCSS